MVWLGSHKSTQGDIVLTGNNAVGQLAAEYLLDRGHRRLGALNVLGDAAAIARLRYFKFIAMENSADVNVFTPTKVSKKVWDRDINIKWFDRAVEEQIDLMLSLKSRPTGLFVLSDFQVAATYRALAKRGIKVGEDIEIIGTDYEKAALLGLYPRPATIDLGYKTIGRLAVEHLMNQITNGQRESVKIMFTPKLILVI